MSTVIQKIETFLSASDMKPTRFGIEAMGDPTLVFRLRKGADVRTRTAAKIEKFIADYWREHSKEVA